MALGAQAGDIIRMVLRAALQLLAPGLAIGGLLAWWAGSMLSRVLPGVSVWDVTAFLLVASLLAAVALLACWFPARRAAAVDPLTALRAE